MSKKDSLRLTVSAATWRNVHPQSVVCKSDMFYARLASRLATLSRQEIAPVVGMSSDDHINLGVMMAAYLEDKVTGLHIWDAFIALYRKMMGRDFPFFDIAGEEIYPEEPNFSEVRLLLWMAIDKANKERIINPLTKEIERIAGMMMEILIDAYESAPESNEFRDAIFEPSQYDDVLRIRDVCKWVAQSSYLFADNEFGEKTMSMLEETLDGDDSLPAIQLLYYIQCSLVTDLVVGPLALHSWQWMAEMFRQVGNHVLADRFDTIDFRCAQPYKIAKRHPDHLKLIDISHNSLDLYFDMLTPEVIADFSKGVALTANLFRIDGKWQINGMCFITPSLDSYNEVAEETAEKKRNGRASYDYHMKINGNTPIGVAADWNEFYKRFFPKKIEERSSEEMNAYARSMKRILYFIDSDGEMQMTPDEAQCVALPGNPFYDKAIATKNASMLILGDDTTDEERRYLIDNNLIPDARLSGGAPDDEAKAWFRANASFLNLYRHTDHTVGQVPGS